MTYRDVVEIWRGQTRESVHQGACVACDREGRPLFHWGAPETVTFLRSSAKPFQALALLEAGGETRFGLTPQQLALICASHAGTDEHVEVLRSIHAQVGISEANLSCGTHTPFDHATAIRLQRERLDPTPIRHNCSGKHTGMLALAKLRGEPLTGYTDPDHPVQQTILQVISEMSCDDNSIRLGVDGCSVPTFAMPLRAAARAYARLMDPTGLPQGRAHACRTVVAAMTAHPRMVSGHDRFDTLLMETTKGRLLAKGGADGYQAVGIPAAALGPDEPAVGLALKIADGDLGGRARSRFTLAVLAALGALEPQEQDFLGRRYPAAIHNDRGMRVGHYRTLVTSGEMQAGTG
jgi:L-asparaginase II